MEVLEGLSPCSLFNALHMLPIFKGAPKEFGHASEELGHAPKSWGMLPTLGDASKD